MEADVLIPQELRTRYLDRRRKDLEILRSALAAHAFDEFKRIGHQLKGNAASFGYGELEKVAVQLEAAGEQRDSLEAGRQLQLFQQWLNRTSLGNGT